MTHRPDPAALPPSELDASLARLGVRELEERLELSPLLAGADLQDSDGCTCTCSCDDVPPDPVDPLLLEKIANTRIVSPLI